MASICIVCRLPRGVRDEVNALGRRGIPLRAIAAVAAERGHPEILKGSVHRHLKHASPAVEPDLDKAPEDCLGLSVALLTADILQRWPTLASELAGRLEAEGLTRAAAVVVAAVPGKMRQALEAASAVADVPELLQARALTRAVGSVLSKAAPDVSRAIAKELQGEGLHDLAQPFLELAEQVESASSHCVAVEGPDAPSNSAATSATTGSPGEWPASSAHRVLT